MLDSKLINNLNDDTPWLRYTGRVLHTVKTPFGQTMRILECEDLSEQYADDPAFIAWKAEQEKLAAEQSRANLPSGGYQEKYWVDYSLGGNGPVYYLGSHGTNNLNLEQKTAIREKFSIRMDKNSFKRLLAELTMISVVDSNVALFESQAFDVTRWQSPGYSEYNMKDYLRYLIDQVKHDRYEWGLARNSGNVSMEYNLRMRIVGYEKLTEVLRDIFDI